MIPGGGTGPEVCVATCKEGIYDGKGGSFSQPWPITFGPDGLVYVGDTGANRISVHDPDGTWLRVFARDVVTGGGTGFAIPVQGRRDLLRLSLPGTGPCFLSGELKNCPGIRHMMSAVRWNWLPLTGPRWMDCTSGISPNCTRPGRYCGI